MKHFIDNKSYVMLYIFRRLSMNKKSKSISSFVREQIFLHTKDKATKEFEKEQKQYKKK